MTPEKDGAAELLLMRGLLALLLIGLVGAFVLTALGKATPDLAEKLMLPALGFLIGLPVNLRKS